MKRIGNTFLYILLPLAFVLAALLVGRYSIRLQDILQAIFHPAQAAAESYRVIWFLRLPRAIAAAMCGAGAADIFNPNGSCTRAMIVTFLYRASK